MRLPTWITRWFSRSEEPESIEDLVPAVVDVESAKQAAIFSVYGLVDKAIDFVEFLESTMKMELKESPRNPAVVFAAMLKTASWLPDNAKKLAEEWARLSPGKAAFEVAVMAVTQCAPKLARSQAELTVQLGYQAYKLLASFRDAVK